ncbi:coiled-coil domain-containing protein 113 [Thalassophryne amazonica]|uniref:coiled-coil domain-containing protein 113 n=1 Tax=Thalassophryne amazonica TaxID=390379 RepID=UPI0014714ACA|nr:coiled-coil domain-containing protein 113 [Thalassophryne amazonica]
MAELTLENKKEPTKEQKETLYDKVQELRVSNAILLAENDMLECFINRQDPQVFVSQSVGEGPAGGFQVDDGGHARRRRSHSSTSDHIQQLSLEQKLYVVNKEILATRSDQQKEKVIHERIQNNYKAALTEAQLRQVAIKKARDDFERKLAKLTENKREMIESEKVLKILQDKSQVTQLQQLNLKNQALKTHIKNLQHRIQMERVECDIDNARQGAFQDYSDQRLDNNLCEVQTNKRKVQRILISHREKLQWTKQELKEVIDNISRRTAMLAKIEEELQHAEKERVKAEALKQHLSHQMTDYSAPNIIDYMHVKKKHKELQCSIRTVERKIGIAKMALKSHRRMANTQRAANCAEDPAGSPHKAATGSVEEPDTEQVSEI